MTSGYFPTRAAELGLDEIWDYTAERWGTGQADRNIRVIHAALARLAEFPGAGRQVDEIREGYRILPIETHCAFYRALTGGIEVVRILHGSMGAHGKFASAKLGG